MKKKDYILIADAIKVTNLRTGQDGKIDLAVLVWQLGHALKQDNLRFDYNKFDTYILGPSK